MGDILRTWIDQPAQGSGVVVLRPTEPFISNSDIRARIESIRSQICEVPDTEEDEDCSCCDCCAGPAGGGSAQEVVYAEPGSGEASTPIGDSSFPEGSLEEEVSDIAGIDPEAIYNPDAAAAIDKKIRDLMRRIRMAAELERRKRLPAFGPGVGSPLTPSGLEQDLSRWHDELSRKLERLRRGLAEKFQLHWPTYGPVLEPKLAPSGSAKDLETALGNLKKETGAQAMAEEPDKVNCCVLQLRGWRIRADKWFAGPLDLALSQDTHEGIHAPVHCWLNLRSRAGRYYVLEAGQDGEGRLSVSPYPDHIRLGGAEYHLDLTGVNVCSVVTKLISFTIGDEYDARWKYFSIGPNSNSLLAKLLADAGLFVSQPSGAVGWTHFDPYLENLSESGWDSKSKIERDLFRVESEGKPYYGK